jgi:amidohydrolase
MEGVDAVLALHVDTDLDTGDIMIEAGLVSAGADTLYASIIGQAGHGASPHEVVDSVYLAGHVILALHGITSRRIKPFDPAVITIGSIHGGQADNVIPERVDLAATIRYREPKVQETLHLEIERALGVSRALGGDYEREIEIGYPPTLNDAGITETVREVVTDLLGSERLKPPDQNMGAEDFGFFSSLAPGAMFSLGCRIKDEDRIFHSPYFDIDEACLSIGTAILAEAALRLLRQEAEN